MHVNKNLNTQKERTKEEEIQIRTTLVKWIRSATLQMWEFRVLEKLGLKKKKSVMAVLAVAPNNSPPVNC